MKLRSLFILAALALPIGGAIAIAQPPGQQGGGEQDECGHHGGRGRHGGPPGGLFMKPEKLTQHLTLMLSLDTTQQARVRQIVDQTVASFAEERQARQSGERMRPTAEQRTARKAAHMQRIENAANQIAALLRPDQKVIFDRMRAVMAAHKQEMENRREERSEERSERGPRGPRRDQQNSQQGI